MSPFFYVVIPFYNVAPYLQECIQSVLSQTYCHFKVILIKALSPIFPLVRRSLNKCTQIPILCWLRDQSLCAKGDLAFLLPYMQKKTKLAYYFSAFARIWVKMRKF